MNGIGRYGSVIEVDELGFMGTWYESPNKLLTAAHGDRTSSSNPTDRWLVILDGDNVIHQEKFSVSITDIVIKNSGLIFLDLYNRATGVASFAIIRRSGELVFKGRGALNFTTMILLDDESWLIHEDGECIKTLDLTTGVLGKKRPLPSLRLEALKLASMDTVEAVMFGGEVVSLKFR